MNNKIFAMYDEKSIRVYQAYNNTIANEAIENGTFGKSFKMERMTWIKPSFLWMMYRSGWATKEGQNRILAIDMKRSGFDFIVKNAVLSSFSRDVYETKEIWKDALTKTEIRCQWDPERDIYGNPQIERTIQLGIKGKVVEKYVNDWILNITDVTQMVIDIRTAIKENRFADSMLPVELEY
jgi:hypothetical protein